MRRPDLTFWTNPKGEIIADATGGPVLCDLCPAPTEQYVVAVKCRRTAEGTSDCSCNPADYADLLFVAYSLSDRWTGETLEYNGILYQAGNEYVEIDGVNWTFQILFRAGTRELAETEFAAHDTEYWGQLAMQKCICCCNAEGLVDIVMTTHYLYDYRSFNSWDEWYHVHLDYDVVYRKRMVAGMTVSFTELDPGSTLRCESGTWYDKGTIDDHIESTQEITSLTAEPAFYRIELSEDCSEWVLKEIDGVWWARVCTQDTNPYANWWHDFDKEWAGTSVPRNGLVPNGTWTFHGLNTTHYVDGRLEQKEVSTEIKISLVEDSPQVASGYLAAYNDLLKELR